MNEVDGAIFCSAPAGSACAKISGKKNPSPPRSCISVRVHVDLDLDMCTGTGTRIDLMVARSNVITHQRSLGGHWLLLRKAQLASNRNIVQRDVAHAF